MNRIDPNFYLNLRIQENITEIPYTYIYIHPKRVSPSTIRLPYKVANIQTRKQGMYIIQIPDSENAIAALNR